MNKLLQPFSDARKAFSNAGKAFTSWKKKLALAETLHRLTNRDPRWGMGAKSAALSFAIDLMLHDERHCTEGNGQALLYLAQHETAPSLQRQAMGGAIELFANTEAMRKKTFAQGIFDEIRRHRRVYENSDYLDSFFIALYATDTVIPNLYVHPNLHVHSGSMVSVAIMDDGQQLLTKREGQPFRSIKVDFDGSDRRRGEDLFEAVNQCLYRCEKAARDGAPRQFTKALPAYQELQVLMGPRNARLAMLDEPRPPRHSAGGRAETTKPDGVEIKIYRGNNHLGEYDTIK